MPGRAAALGSGQPDIRQPPAQPLPGQHEYHRLAVVGVDGGREARGGFVAALRLAPGIGTGGGTGLGLSITRALCQAMGGRIDCHSTLGVGSSFEVTLPLPRAPAAPDVAQAPPAAAAPRQRPLQGHVLLAEDNEINAIVAEAALVGLGLSVERVDSGSGVVERVCQQDRPRPDLVLLDCQMPGMGGFEAARRVRAHEAQHHLPRLPLVALTANVFPEDRAQCRAAGMDDYLAKPFTSEALRAMLDERAPA